MTTSSVSPRRPRFGPHSWTGVPVLLVSVATLASAQPDAARGEPANRSAAGIANTAQSVPKTPPDTLIARHGSPDPTHRDHGDPDALLPARSQGKRKPLGSGDGWYWTGLISLSGVLAIIFLLGLLVKRFVLPRTRLGHRDLEVIARTYLGNKQSIALVRVGTQLMVVGVTVNHVTSLGTLEDPGEVARLLGSAAAGKPGSITSRFARDVAVEAERFEQAHVVELPYRHERTGSTDRVRGQVREAVERVRRLGRRKTARKVPVPGWPDTASAGLVGKE